jgi:flagellar protein FlbD
MITITRLNGKKVTINSELIESMEQNPDTTITMTTGNKYIAKESIAEITDKVIDYKRGFFCAGLNDGFS